MTIDLNHYQFTAADGGADYWTATLLGTEDTPFSIPALDTTYYLITKIINDTASPGTTNTLEYRKNGGTWTTVDTASSNVRSTTSTPTDAANGSVQRLTDDGFTDDGTDYDDNGNNGDAQPAGSQTEYYWSIQFRSADLASGDYIEFRVLKGGTPVVLNVTPRANNGSSLTLTDVADFDETPGSGTEAWDDGTNGLRATGTGFM